MLLDELETAGRVEWGEGASQMTTSHKRLCSAPSVTTTVAGDKLVAVYGLTANTTVAPAVGMADRADLGAAGTSPLTVAVDDVDAGSAGVTGAKTATSAASANAAIATIALKAAGGGSLTTTRYGFTGDGDTPDFTMNGSNAVIERDVALLGGASITKRSAGDVWSYPNIHGDTAAVADAAGVKQGSTLTYDPFGQQLGGLPDNSDGNYDYAWLGSKQRGLEHEGTINTIEMGARQYVPGLGRFLEVDPIEGGSANNYDYVNQDPINQNDIGGTNAALLLAGGEAAGGTAVCLGGGCEIAAGVAITAGAAYVSYRVGGFLGGLVHGWIHHAKAHKKNRTGGVNDTRAGARARALQATTRFNNNCPPGLKASFRGPCSKGDHYHMDVIRRATGKVVETFHYFFK